MHRSLEHCAISRSKSRSFDSRFSLCAGCAIIIIINYTETFLNLMRCSICSEMLYSEHIRTCRKYAHSRVNTNPHFGHGYFSSFFSSICVFFLHSARSNASSSFTLFSTISSLIVSIHLFGGLPLRPFPGASQFNIFLQMWFSSLR